MLIGVPDPSQMSPQELALEHVSQLHARAATPVRQILDYVCDSWRFVWQNPFGLSPQEACDLVHKAAVWRRSNAAEAFATHAAAVAFLKAIAPQWISAPYDALPAGVSYTVNADGSLTLHFE